MLDPFYHNFLTISSSTMAAMMRTFSLSTCFSFTIIGSRATPDAPAIALAGGSENSNSKVLRWRFAKVSVEISG